MLLCGSMAYAQNDPVVMTVNGAPVSRSEFEYSYNKNNSEGVIDKKTVGEYVDLFVNYKLKVQAALDARLDTMSSFKKEFREYRDQQVRPTLVTDADVEAKARDIYRETQQRVDGGGGLLKTSHILLLLDQNATKTQQDAAKVRIDSVYNALKKVPISPIWRVGCLMTRARLSMAGSCLGLSVTSWLRLMRMWLMP